MKKYANGSEMFWCKFGLLFMIFLLLNMVYWACDEYLLLGFLVLSCVMFPFYYYPFLFCLFRLRKCYYVIDDEIFSISILIAKKRRYLLDVYYINQHVRNEFTMQPVSYEFNYSDVLKVVCLAEIKKSIKGLHSNDICFILNDDKKAYISRKQFSKKQVLEIVNTMLEKNSNIELGERLKRELKLN